MCTSNDGFGYLNDMLRILCGSYKFLVVYVSKSRSLYRKHAHNYKQHR
jgi:hypothetical protein